MAINNATKFEGKVDERFKLGSFTEGYTNNDYDWTGVKTVTVYSIPTVPTNDYNMSGANRFGTPSELGDTTQEMQVTIDSSFTTVIDRLNYNNTMMTKSANKWLKSEIDEVVVPEVDMYRLNKVFETAFAIAGQNDNTAITKTNAYDRFLKGTESLDNAGVPMVGRVCYATPYFYNLLKQDSSFHKDTNDAFGNLVKGKVGEVDGIEIIKVPAKYFAPKVAFVMFHKSALISPKKLASYRIQENPVGIDGWVPEGRTTYDAFILNNKKCSVYAHVESIGSGTAVLSALTGGKVQVQGIWTPVKGNKLVYTTAASITAPTLDQDLSSWTSLTLNTDISGTAGNKFCVAEVTASGKARRISQIATL